VVLTVNVEPAPAVLGVTGLGLALAVIPAGSAPTEIVTALLYEPTAVNVTANVVLDPCATVCEEGVTDIPKSEAVADVVAVAVGVEVLVGLLVAVGVSVAVVGVAVWVVGADSKGVAVGVAVPVSLAVGVTVIVVVDVGVAVAVVVGVAIAAALKAEMPFGDPQPVGPS